MRPVLPILIGTCLAGLASAQFTSPSQLDVTSVNGVTKDTPVVTSDFEVSAGFETNAAGAVFIVFPLGAAGGPAIVPGQDAVLVHVPRESAGTPFTIKLATRAVGPAAATTLPTFAGQGTKQVIVDVEPPEVTITGFEVDGERKDKDEPLFVNKDFKVLGTIVDNVSKGEDLKVKARMGSFEGEVQADSGGQFSIDVAVAGLADGSYELELTGEDKMDDQSRVNARVLRIELSP